MNSFSFSDEGGSAAHAHNRRAWDELVPHSAILYASGRGRGISQPAGGRRWLQLVGGRHPRLASALPGGGRGSAKRALCGGRRQRVTVIDISPAMLELDRIVATERGLDVVTVQASMDDLSMFGPAAFDLVIHPVSTCYVPKIEPVYREVARVLRGDGLYVSQHKTPQNLQASLDPSARGYELVEPYYREGPLPPAAGSRAARDGHAGIPAPLGRNPRPALSLRIRDRRPARTSTRGPPGRTGRLWPPGPIHRPLCAYQGEAKNLSRHAATIAAGVTERDPNPTRKRGSVPLRRFGLPAGVPRRALVVRFRLFLARASGCD